MKEKKLIWQIFLVNFFVLVVTVVSVSWFGRTALQDFYQEDQGRGLMARAQLVKPIVAKMLEQGNVEKLRRYCKSAGRESNTRLTVILPDGRVVADSNEDPAAMEPHHQRTEIKAALQGETGKSLRFSRTIEREMLYVAVPIYSRTDAKNIAGETAGVKAVLRMSVTVDAIEVALRQISSKLLLGVIAIAFLMSIASFLVSRNITSPLEEIKQAAERFSRGDFSKRMTSFQGTSASLEVIALAAAMDRMAGQLSERIETIKTQRNELETVFSSMVESVIAVDKDERVININKAAATLLGVDENKAKGRVIQEILRNIGLQQQIRQVISSGISVEDEIIHTDGDGEKFLQTNIVSLSDQKLNVMGVLVVMNDVTKLRRLERVRRDFVANVSHELRTPITSIRGYVETLLDGALDDRDDTIRFLNTVLRQAERLNEIIDDLLALSRIEQEADHGQIKLARGSLCVVLDVAVETCQHRAEEAGVSIELDCPEGLQLDMNETLIEQALVNLLVNAVKYSKRGGIVSVVAWPTEEQGDKVIKIAVTDRGVGIASNHLPRLFERFYRSDKARSREQGGTGLGLAIVKHIVLAHNGEVEVSSELNVGSTFTITLPWRDGL
ncbi:MAG: ATP-binding protein [Desulfopila sp.]|jgi:two-component system phosphate regulon sensor histidine kinase PhoR|nr:ATP-binding protein [Desulfopila sp.]